MYFGEVIPIDLYLSRRLRRLLGQRFECGAAAVLHGDRNAERRVEADARSSHQ